MMSLCPLPQLVLSWTSTATLVVSFSPHLSPLPFLPWMLVITTVVVGELEKVLLPLHWDIPSTHTLHCKCQHSKLTIFLISSKVLPVSTDFYLLCWVPVPHFQPRSHHISLQPFTTGPISTFQPNGWHHYWLDQAGQEEKGAIGCFNDLFLSFQLRFNSMIFWISDIIIYFWINVCTT